MAKIIESMGSISISSLEAISHSNFGQILLKGLDRCMGIIENTSQWSLPYQEIVSEENGKSFKEIKLVRPLPWILFLPSLLILRSFRLVWNIGSYIIGYPKIQPSDIVKHLQKARQRLRSIRINGGKKVRKTRPSVRDKSLRINEARRSLMKSIQLTLSSLSCLDASKVKSSPSPTRVRVYTNDIAITPDEKSATESTIASQHYDPKRKYATISSDDHSSDESDRETLHSKIDRYALINSSDDEDFDPAEYSSQSESTSTDEEFNSEELLEELKEDDNGDNVKLLREKLLRTSDVERKKLAKELFSIFPDLDFSSTQKETQGNGTEKLTKMPSEEQKFYSPKSLEDGGIDTAFYSPLSSTSSSPEPKNNDTEIVDEDQKKTSDNSIKEVLSMPSVQLSENGEKKEHASKNEVNSTIEEESVDPLEIITENLSGLSAGKNKQNHNQKGKRNNHGNRKKK